MIHLLFTGGTISMTRDTGAGGNVPAHGGAALVDFAGGLDSVGAYRIEDWARMPACHLTQDRLWALRERVRAVVESGEVRGVVVTHGTDLLEETAYLLGRTLPRRVPVVLTGAMRTASDDGWDGPRNLTDAATVAAAAASGGRGAMVAFHGRVFDATEAAKMDTVGLDAFGAPHAEPVGEVCDGRVVFRREAPGATLEPPALGARVALVSLVLGDDGSLLDAARGTHDGVVVVAFGSGNAPPGVVGAVERWLGDGKPVVLASRCPFGEVTPLYAFDGGGARLVRLGVTPAGPRTPSQARMELTIALSAGVPYGAAAR